MAVLLARGVSRAPADTPSAWRAALDQFLRELSQEEQFSFRTASMRPDKPEALLTGAMLSEVQFSLKSPARGALKRLEHTIQALDQFKVVVDIFAEIYPTGLAPIWGCIRLVMQGGYCAHLPSYQLLTRRDRLPKSGKSILTTSRRSSRLSLVSFLDYESMNACTITGACSWHFRLRIWALLSFAWRS